MAQEIEKGVQSLQADMMRDALGVDTCDLRADPQGAEEILDDLVALTAYLGEAGAGIGKEHTAIGPLLDEPFGGDYFVVPGRNALGQTSLVWKDTRVGGRAIRTGGEQRICATRMVCAPVKPWQHPLPVYHSHYRLCAVVFGRNGFDDDDRSCRAQPLLSFSRFPNHLCAVASR